MYIQFSWHLIKSPPIDPYLISRIGPLGVVWSNYSVTNLVVAHTLSLSLYAHRISELKWSTLTSQSHAAK